MNLLIINRLKKQFNNNDIIKNYLSLIIILIYSYFWISIGKFVEINFNNFFNNGLINIIIFSVCLFILIIKLINNRKLPTISILLIYPIASSIGYFNNINVHQSFDLLIHFFLTISTLFIFLSILEDHKDRKKLFKYFLKISLFFIFLVYSILVFPDLVNRIINNIHVRDISFVTLNLFFIDYDQFFLYNKNGKWYGHDKYCFVKPIPKKDYYIEGVNIKEEPLHGILKYSNKQLKSLGVKEGDQITFTPESEYEFYIDEEKLYRMFTDNITMVV